MNLLQNEKAVLISINPKWCELIARGEKTVEIRKTKPKLNTPFKVYIYCTLPPKSEIFWYHEEGRRTLGEYAHELLKLPDGRVVYDYGMRLACEEGEYSQDNFLCKKIIGEFICDSIEWIGQSSLVVKEDADKALAGSCLTREDIFKYLELPRKQGDDKYRACYGWHISNLVIYDKPKALTDFFTPAKCPYQTADGCTYDYHCYRAGERQRCGQVITKPPQSWCYVSKV